MLDTSTARSTPAWRRTSYSGLIRGVDAPGVSSEPETAGKDDEAPDATDVAAEGTGTPPESPVSPMAELPAGAAFGSLVHAVLENADPLAGRSGRRTD